MVKENIDPSTMNTLINEIIKAFNVIEKLHPTPPQDKGNVLFTTDGVEIEKAKDYWFLNPHTFHYWKADNDRLFTNDWWLIFSTEQAAKDWILENKPCLSLSDLFLLGITEHHQYYKMLSKLAKQKLNQ